jgi:hypothetical protein
MPATYDKIATYTAPSAQTAITFSSIPSTYTDLIIVSSQFYTTAGSDRFATFQVGNGAVDTGTNYSLTYLDTYTGSAGSGRNTNLTYGLHSYTTTIPTTTPMICIMQIQNYSNTTTNKTMLNRFGAEATMTGMYVNLWRSTAAINIITIAPGGANFATGSMFTVYGIKAA